MRRFLAPFFGVTLCLMLALTGQSMAVARGATAATGQMVICTGAGVVTVYTDAEGQPTGAPHLCPDCIVMTDKGAQAPSAAIRSRLAPVQAPVFWQQRSVFSLDHIGFQSRAPPAWV